MTDSDKHEGGCLCGEVSRQRHMRPRLVLK